MEEKNVPPPEIAEPKEKRLAQFGKLFDEIFVNHRCYLGDSFANPLNLETIEAEAREKLTDRQERQRQLFESLSEVATAINEHGGITEEVYKQHKAAINRFVREWLEIGGIGYRPDSEDRLDQPATAEVLERYPEDGEFKTNYGPENIFNFHRKKEEIPGYNPTDMRLFVHSDEGIMWHREYKGKKGVLSHFKIFNQGHRNALDVVTVKIPELYKEIQEFVSTFKEESLSIPELGISRAEYQQAMVAFNREFAGLMEIRIGYGEWDDYEKEFIFYPPDPELVSLSEVQPWLVVKSGHQELARAIASANSDLIVTERDFSIVEFPQKNYERTRVFPVKGKEKEESFLDIHSRQEKKHEWLKTGLLRYLAAKL